MKYDTKDILIAVFLGCSLFFGYSWYFKGDDGSKQRVKALEIEFTQLQLDKTNSDKKIVELKTKFETMRAEDLILKSKVISLSKRTIDAETRAANSKIALDDARAKSIKIRESVKLLEKTPRNLTGEALIESLKTKLK